MFETEIRDGVLRVGRPETRWLSTGWDGGHSRGDAAYNVTVPSGWERTDLDRYVTDRLEAAGFEPEAPVLLTGVSQEHARVARTGSVAVIATVGLSNPATLPPDPEGESVGGTREDDAATHERPPGTCNLFVGTTRDLDPGALANLLTVAAEAKTATLLSSVGFTGTTSDAVVAACDPAGEPAAFSGSATPVGNAVRACIRDAITASLRSRYVDERPPESVAEAEHGIATTTTAEVFEP
ncbi:adenosylcobinamide amidohydrolase [Halapricum desulfuricans]|uniref:adenosylcobinamide amidohydrolase n=1 Tax=Halapricum desulfuricans TaxID=2841257 RepID=UPI001E2E0FEF|nr:adenosylcobinamide amidohydrolase [Halapricum desulfuricans]